ncbi:MAG: hypothetical protein PVI75_01900 [Gammaproteobacteria bacterium]|jgi:hypothetical protein
MSYTKNNKWSSLFKEVDEVLEVGKSLKKEILNLLKQPIPKEIHKVGAFQKFIEKEENRKRIVRVAYFDEDLCGEFLKKTNIYIERAEKLAKMNKYDGCVYVSNRYLSHLQPLQKDLGRILDNYRKLERQYNNPCSIL